MTIPDGDYAGYETKELPLCHLKALLATLPWGSDLAQDVRLTMIERMSHPQYEDKSPYTPLIISLLR